jgi:hypothetical protein
LSEALRAFRRNAVHVRQALGSLTPESGQVRVEGGYLGEAGQIERYKLLSIPVRRALKDSDRASFAAALAELKSEPSGNGAAGDSTWRPAADAWQRLQQELDSTVVLGGSRVRRREILGGWLEAAAFYDKLDRDRAYDQLMDRLGKAAEGIGAQLMEEAARVVLLLDEAAAAALSEPVILPPPAKTPPPPPDPKEPWWRRLI